MRELKAANLGNITLQIKEFSIEKLQDELGWEYTVTGTEDGKYDYCYVINNKNGNKSVYIEYGNNSITKIIGYVDSIVTSDDKVITIQQLIKQYGTQIQSGVCNNPEISVEDTLFPYVIDGKCVWCPFNITSECEHLNVGDLDTTLIENLGIVIKEYLDNNIGIEIIKNKGEKRHETKDSSKMEKQI